MSIKRFTQTAGAALLACTFAGTAWAAGSAGRGENRTVKLLGCLLRGEGDGAGYLLTNAPGESWLSSANGQVTPSAVGTTGDYASIFYWLDRNDDLRQHIGHRVEIEGDLKGDLKDGEIKTDRKENWTEVTVKADGRTMKARVPNTSMFPASDRDKEHKSDILVRRVDVEHVRMLGASCN